MNTPLKPCNRRKLDPAAAGGNAPARELAASALQRRQCGRRSHHPARPALGDPRAAQAPPLRGSAAAALRCVGRFAGRRVPARPPASLFAARSYSLRRIRKKAFFLCRRERLAASAFVFIPARPAAAVGRCFARRRSLCPRVAPRARVASRRPTRLEASPASASPRGLESSVSAAMAAFGRCGVLPSRPLGLRPALAKLAAFRARVAPGQCLTADRRFRP